MYRRRLKQKIDTVVGPNRLPDFYDRPSLPYINAVLKETLRWNLVAPLGTPFFIIFVATLLTSFEAIPHMSIIDDEYNGFYIPKLEGTIVIGKCMVSTVTAVNLIFCAEFLI